MSRLKVAYVAAELTSWWLALGKLLAAMALPCLLLSAGCTLKTGTPLASTRPGQRIAPPSIAPPPAPVEPIPSLAWDGPLTVRVDSPVAEMAIRLGVRLRHRHGAGFVFEDEKLMATAQYHADWMARTGKLGHQGDRGTWPADRVRIAGYDASAVGEVVAGDFENPINAINGWLQSPGHKRTILDPQYTQAGYGMAIDARGRKCWVALFARPK